jgi:hypothetical protein
LDRTNYVEKLLSFSLGPSGNASLYGNSIFSGSFGGLSSGTAIGNGSIFLLNTPISGSGVETIFLEVNVTNGSQMTLTFPLNFGPVDAAAAPEPATIATLGVGCWAGCSAAPKILITTAPWGRLSACTPVFNRRSFKRTTSPSAGCEPAPLQPHCSPLKSSCESILALT